MKEKVSCSFSGCKSLFANGKKTQPNEIITFIRKFSAYILSDQIKSPEFEEGK
jgi:hypothetical protein